MAPITITQALSASYNVPLPYYENRKGLQTASDPGETTKKYLAPAFAIKLDVSVWTNIGQLVLKDIKDGRLTRMIDEQYINEKEISMVHRNEADVVRAAAVHLLHSVNQALDLCPAVGQSMVVHSEAQQNRMRTDVSYSKIINGTPKPMAIIEFKRRGILHDNEFMKGPVKKKVATATSTNIPLPTPAEIKKWEDEAKSANSTEKTLFKRNALKCMKQISAYAVDRNTKYCALFDYDALVLVRFDQHDQTQNSVGNYCTITYIPYTNSSQFMRAALLGFLFEAWANTK
jgi:hypothetical protein